MKKWMLLCMALLLFAITIPAHFAVSGHTPEQTGSAAERSAPVIDQFTVVEQGKGDAKIALCIPDGWEYEKVEGEEGIGIDFGIVFRPEGYTEGVIRINHYTDFFGVCGTGLSTKEIMVGKYDATQGTYDDRPVWDFIRLTDRYAILNIGADEWWEEYGATAMDILNTLQISE